MGYRDMSRIAGLCLVLGACVRTSVSEEATSKAFKVVPIEGTDLSRIILTQSAARRLDIQGALVRAEPVHGKPRKVVPYAAVLYDKDGHTWVYTSPESLTFVRAPITVDYIEGELAVLSVGPPAGIKVVTVGATELYGCEEEFEEE